MTRRKRVTPGTMIDLTTASKEEIIASINFLNDYNRGMRALADFRRQCEANGKDPFQELAQAMAHNRAVDDGITRLKKGGTDKVKANAAKRHALLEKRLEKAGGSVKAVEIDTQQLKRRVKGRSERTLRRVKKSMNRA